MKNLLLLLVVLSGTLGLAQDKTNNIKGKVTYLDTPLVNAEVRVSTSGETVKTDTEGKYAVAAAPGQIITYSYPSMRSMEIVVEDVTRILNVELTPEVNQLDEVVVSKTVLKSQKEMREEYALNKNIINTAFGFIDKETTNFSISIVEGKDLNPIGIDIATSLQYAIPSIKVERIPPINPVATIYLRGASMGMFPAIYDVDGLVMREFPFFLQVENIERVAVLRGLGAVVKYGGAANGGVIVINTKGANYYNNNTQVPNDLARLKGNIYDGGALASEKLEGDKPSYLTRLLASETEEEAKNTYREQIKIYGSSFYYVLDAYDYFSNRWNNKEFADKIIEENNAILKDNPIALKVLAYTYQAEGRLEEANDVYKEIFTLRPNYAQSYMDIANSYRELGEYQKAAAIYARYGYLLEEGFLRAEGDLGIIMERELNNLIALKGRELLSKRELKKLVLDDEFDGTRLVFEWNDSEAEFELQFVNPEGNYFKSEHSLLADADRIKDEKISGFSSEEYHIDDSIRGVWQVNAKYFGNKSLTPTYLKATVYHNYGSASQRKETKLFKLSLRNVNQQLFTVTNLASVVSN
ncbi:carboxypeptidase-like regulatory domain-containing protein [Maribacter aestuarii]|uniref:carboxypeptidase-like regulatory domain-containing protein n=1 Tax=Maribacter aestuarii TaxID=1130723 RepID=UPI0025A5FD0A|nr:carboxypeptidase-like regulatory domain-containing protein [Maribacter aestuarii]